MNDEITALRNLIWGFQSKDIKSLDKSSTLGDGYAFEKLRTKTKFIQTTLRNIDLESLKFIEVAKAKALSQSLGKLNDLCSQIEKLHIQSGDVPKISQEIKTQFESGFQDFQRAVQQPLFLYSKYNMCSESLLEHIVNAEKIDTRLDELKNKSDTINKSIDLTREEVSQFTSSFINTRNELSKDLTSFKNKTSEKLKLNGVAILWSQREKNYQIWHVAFSLILLVIFLMFIAAIWASLSLDTVNVISRLLTPQTEGGVTNWPQFLSYTLPRFIIFGLPVAGSIWFVRILLRLYLTNLAMLEDAKQRKTILDTYFSLIEDDPDAEKERHLLLNAMFRPLPGEPNDIEPPNLSELMTLGKNK